MKATYAIAQSKKTLQEFAYGSLIIASEVPKNRMNHDSSFSNVEEPNYEPPTSVGASSSSASTSHAPILYYTEAINDDKGHDNDFSFPS